MKKTFLLGLLLLVTQSVTANSQTVELKANDLENKFKDAFPYRSGYAYGVGHCYGFMAPVGWKLDNSLASQGIAMAFLPQNESWNTADTAMYTHSAAYENTDEQKMVELQIADVQQMYRAAGKNIQAEYIQDILSASGEKGSLWRFSGYGEGLEELAAYFPAKPNLNYFIAQVGGDTDKQKVLQVLIELAKSYHQRSECKPCQDTGCTVE